MAPIPKPARDGPQLDLSRILREAAAERFDIGRIPLWAAACAVSGIERVAMARPSE
jgi:hypothetical protein